MFMGPFGKPKALEAEYVGGFLCGQRRHVDGSPLRVGRIRDTSGPAEVVYDHYRLVQMGPGAFIYRHQGEEDGESE